MTCAVLPPLRATKTTPSFNGSILSHIGAYCYIHGSLQMCNVMAKKSGIWSDLLSTKFYANNYQRFDIFAEQTNTHATWIVKIVLNFLLLTIL